MTSSTDSIKKSLNCFQPIDEILKNHQKWDIHLQLDCQAGYPTIHLKDPHGISHEVTEIVIENLDSDFEQQLMCSEDREGWLHQFLQQRLFHATPHQVHVISHEGRLYLHLGDYGLKGGGREEALALSAAQFGLGVFFSTSRKLKIPGAILISAGISGGYYIFRKTQENFRWKEYGLQTLQGAIAGGVTGAVTQVCQGLGIVGRVIGQVAGGVISSSASAASVQMIESGHVNGTSLLNKACQGGIGALTSTLTGEMIHVFAPPSEGVQAVAFQTFKGGVSAATSKAATNVYEGEEFSHEVLEAAMVGGGVGGLIESVEQVQKFQELEIVQKLKDKLQQVQNELASKKSSLEILQKQPVDTTEAQQLVSQMEQSIAKTQNAASLAVRQLEAAEKIARQMQESYEHSAQQVDREIKSFIGRGFKAKIKNHITKSSSTIREALLNGEKVEWIPVRNPHEQRHRVQKNPFKLHAKTAEARVLHSQQVVAELEAAIAHQQIGLTIAELQRDIVREQTALSGKQNISLEGIQWGILDEIFQGAPISYVDCDMNELISHVVLVHAVSQDAIDKHAENYDWSQVGDSSHIVRFLLKNQVASDGTIGQYLELEKREFSGEFEQRPQMHWAWNQLVQPNSGALLNPWEKAKIAFLEPLAAFEKSHPHKPFAVAPYDTMVFGSIRLSEKSTILAPAPFVSDLQAQLTGFRGRVVGYDPSKNLRTAVMETLFAHYPETWHVCNPKGELLGSEERYTATGYNPITCLKTTDGRVHILIHQGGRRPENQPSQAMQEYSKAKRFIGLHVDSGTYWLENTDYFKFLKNFSTNKDVAKNHPLLAGHEKKVIDASSLGILEAFTFYQNLIQDLPPQTGCYTVANYVLKEAIFADLVSLFFQEYPDKNFELSTLDLQMILSPVLGTCKKVLKQILHSDQPKAREGFAQYVSLLKACLSDILKVQSQVVEYLGEADLLKTEIVDFGGAQKEWELVQVPDDIEFDLGKQWPLKPQLHAYVSQVYHLLPKKTDQLKHLYHQLQLNSGGDNKELYRINVLCSTVKWALQEKIYLKLIKADTVSPLAALFTRHESWLKDHHLEVCDFTQKLGDCLFDNIIAQASDLTAKTADTLRKELVVFMSAHSEDYKFKPEYGSSLEIAEGGDVLSFTNWDTYLECIAKPQVWATELEIQALSLFLQRPIVLISAGAIPKIYNPQGVNSPIFLNHKNWNHFESCRPLSPHTQQEVYQKTIQETHY